MAIGLAMIAGFLDAYGIITYDTYLSFMSGNTTQAGYKIGQGNFGGAAHAALAIVSFVGGSFAGTLLAHCTVRRIRRLVFGVIATALAFIIGLVLCAGGLAEESLRYLDMAGHSDMCVTGERLAE